MMTEEEYFELCKEHKTEMDELRAELEEVREELQHSRIDTRQYLRERDELQAARKAYASEFPNVGGEPDVGGIHANIRKLKTERDTLRSAVKWAQKVINPCTTVYDIVTSALHDTKKDGG